jgi:hypothetical protein
VPCEKQWLINVVEDINDNVVVAGAVNFGSWELIVDKDNLLGSPKRRNGTIGNIPCIINIRVFTINGDAQKA